MSEKLEPRSTQDTRQTIEPSLYKWKQTSPTPLTWQRPALSSECMWIPRSKASRDIFISCDITVTSPVLNGVLNTATRKAWRDLHFHVPDLDSYTGVENGKAYVRYQTRESEVLLEKTCDFEYGEEEMNFEALREVVGRRSKISRELSEKKGELKESFEFANTFLLLHLRVKDCTTELVEHVQTMLYLDHQVTDGVGARILLGRYLGFFASALGDEGNPILWEKMDWNRAHENLSPSWIALLGDEKLCKRDDYDKDVAWNREVLCEKMQHNPGLSFARPTTVAITTHQARQETHFITLSTAHSNALLHAIKRELGPEATITHLAHAAMVLAMLHSPSFCPGTPKLEGEELYSPCWLNGRRYLDAPSYVPVCMGFAPILFTGLEEMRASLEGGWKGKGKGKDERVKEALLKLCGMAGNGYGDLKRKNRGDVLVGCVELFEELGKGMTRLTTGSSQQQQQPAQQEALKPPATAGKSADPFLLSDGITEQYISHTYPSTSDLTPVFTVEDVHFAAAAESNIIVRLSSWRGRIRISGEWRDSEYERQMVAGFLDDIVALMGIILDDEEGKKGERGCHSQT